MLGYKCPSIRYTPKECAFTRQLKAVALLTLSTHLDSEEERRKSQRKQHPCLDIEESSIHA